MFSASSPRNLKFAILKQLMSKFAFVDIETTGGQRDGNKITEIAIICVDDGVITQEWSSLINPERPIPWGITKLTGITDDMVYNAPKFFSVAKKVIELTEGRVFVAHNAFFDYRFIQREFSELGYRFQREVHCTVRLGRQAFRGLASYSLSNLSKHFNLIRIAEHRALDDAKACYEIFCRIKEANSSLIDDFSTKALPPGLDEFDINKLPTKPGTYSFYSREGALLYIGKAKSIRDRVRQHFQTVGTTGRNLELRKLVAKVEYQEWGSELAASLMELQLIKSLRPSLNRAGRKKHFRYTLTFHPDAEPGDEVRLSTSVSEEHSAPRFGSKKRAKDARSELYQSAFGIEADGLFFKDQMKKFRSILGNEAVIQRLQEKFQSGEVKYQDQEIELPGRRSNEKSFIVIQNSSIHELRFIDDQGELEIYPLEDFPDMRRILSSFLLKNRQLINR